MMSTTNDPVTAVIQVTTNLQENGWSRLSPP